MRRGIRVLLFAVLGLLSTAALTAVAAIVAAISLAATALIVPGTGTPNANIVENYRQHFVDRYSAPFFPDCTSTNGCELVGVNYPASFFPLFIFPNWCVPGRCETWNASVGTGVEGVIELVKNLPAGERALLLGYSQGGAVASNALRELAAQGLLDRIEGVVLIGNAYNPDGGLFTRLGFLPTIPLLNISFGPATPVELADEIGPMVFVGFEYDPVMYAPRYWGNPFAMLNALAAFETVHGYYLTPNGNGPNDPIAYGYTPEEIEAYLDDPECTGPVCREDEYGNRYYMLPAKSLPLMDLVMSLVPEPLVPLARPIVEFLTPIVKVLVDLGYDWSGDPAATTYLSILPFSPKTNLVKVGVDLIKAVQEGIHNVIGDQGPNAVPDTDNDVSLLAASGTPAGESESAPQPFGRAMTAAGFTPEEATAAGGGTELPGATPDQATPLQQATEDGTPPQQATEDGTPPQEVTEDGTPPQGQPRAETSQQTQQESSGKQGTDTATGNPAPNSGPGGEKAGGQPAPAKAVGLKTRREQRQSHWQAAKAEREARREALKADPETKREAAKAEREARRQAFKADPDAKRPGPQTRRDVQHRSTGDAASGEAPAA
ncbi:MAG: PE-PPE domain-containing protein [Mycolicibacterium hassiacum]|uniref:PE-PPE domain-containing protein n=2 Tax=Mycolicibacterium hassiacum TaxID=46351 RepID=UPI0023F7B2BE|nr:PE-PPE domain-containing protein [Mycolicibacterium hassiacum]MBX5485723.1 PE-PPE domain-containing protein [Mycolicibacterium hassiacum]